MPNPVAIILAAGKGERLQPYSVYYQKCILPVEGKPLLVHWIDALKSQPQQLFVNVFHGHHSLQVTDIVRTWELLHWDWDLDAPMINTVETLPMDRVWRDIMSFYNNSPHLKTRNLLLCLGDNYSQDLKQVVYGMLKHQNTLSDSLQGIIGLIPQQVCSKATEEAVLGHRDADGLYSIKEYRHGGTERISTESFAWAGIALFSPKVLEMRGPDTTSELFSLLSKEGKLAGQVIRQVYFDIGTPEGYARVEH